MTYVNKMDSQFAVESIYWNFNQPGALHFGGLWESHCATYHLSCMVRGTTSTLGELQTLLCQVEGCLNSCTLTLLSSNSNNFEPLTSGYFLIGREMMFHP